jgi:hypothetical protein
MGNGGSRGRVRTSGAAALGSAGASGQKPEPSPYRGRQAYYTAYARNELLEGMEQAAHDSLNGPNGKYAQISGRFAANPATGRAYFDTYRRTLLTHAGVYSGKPPTPRGEVQRAAYREATKDFMRVRDDLLDRALAHFDEQQHMEPGTHQELLDHGFVVNRMVTSVAMRQSNPHLAAEWHTARDEPLYAVYRMDGKRFPGTNIGQVPYMLMLGPHANQPAQQFEARIGDRRDVEFFARVVTAHPVLMKPLDESGQAALEHNHRGQLTVQTPEDAALWHTQDAELRRYYGEQQKAIP